MYIASLARWDAQLKGLVELERRCQDLMHQVQLLSERQEVLVGMVVSKRDMQNEAPKQYQENIFEDYKELEEQKGKRSICSQSVKAKGKERECCRDWEDRGRQSIGVTLQTKYVS